MKNFLFGAATSAHQVEGNNVHNDWWAWEKKTVGQEPSGAAADHYNLFRDDFALAKELGHNAHRISLEWSRLELEPGKWNEKGFEHYREVLQSMKDNGLTSFVSLHHFTNPNWLSEQGGWMSAKTPKLFARYARKASQELGDLVDFWITINEPYVYATQSFWWQAWPPQGRNIFKLLKVIRHLALGHELAYHALHKELPEAKVGSAKHMLFYASGNRLADWFFNHRWFKQTHGNHDFIGINYYKSEGDKTKGLAKNDLGWVISPEGFEHELLCLKKYKKPVYVTENGLADAADKLRPDFIRSHLRAVERAQEQGVDIKGYLHWSLLDNFEWADGFGPRFGLVEVDYETQERKPRRSAYVYKAIIEQASNKKGII